MLEVKIIQLKHSAKTQFSVFLDANMLKVMMEQNMYHEIPNAITEAIAKDFVKKNKVAILKKLDRKAISNSVVISVAKKIAQELIDLNNKKDAKETQTKT